MSQYILAQLYSVHIWVTFIIFLWGEEELPKRTEVQACVLKWPPDPGTIQVWCYMTVNFWTLLAEIFSFSFISLHDSTDVLYFGAKGGTSDAFYHFTFLYFVNFLQWTWITCVKKKGFLNFYVVRLWIVSFRPIPIKSF